MSNNSKRNQKRLVVTWYKIYLMPYIKAFLIFNFNLINKVKVCKLNKKYSTIKKELDELE